MGFKVFNREILKKYPEAKILAVPGSQALINLGSNNFWHQ